VYGNATQSVNDDDGIVLGAMAPRGETGVLLLAPGYFLRARHNPFYQYQADTIVQWLDSE
jgi:hypothetical protein